MNSAFWVICLGSFFGGVTKGLTGFGSAIILVLIWVSAKVVGIDSGPLTTAVLCDCIATSLSAIPLLVMTKAHKTADPGLAATLLVFKSALAPLGALALVVLNKRIVELVMGCALALIILMSVDVQALKKKLNICWFKLRGASYSQHDSSHRSPAGNGLGHRAEWDKGTGETDPLTCVNSQTVVSQHDIPVRHRHPAAHPHNDGSLAAWDTSSLHVNIATACEAGVQPTPGASACTAEVSLCCISTDQSDDGQHISSSKSSSGLGCSPARDVSCVSGAGAEQQGQQQLEGTVSLLGTDSIFTPSHTQSVLVDCLSAPATTIHIPPAVGQASADHTIHHHSQGLQLMDTDISRSVAADRYEALQQHTKAGQQQHLAKAAVRDCRNHTLYIVSSEEPVQESNQTDKDDAAATEALLPKTHGQHDSSAACDARPGPAPPSWSWRHPVQSARQFGWFVVDATVRYVTDRNNRKVLIGGSIAGALSGLMDGLTGMGGPPVMYLYALLNTPKEVARGVGAVINLIQFRIVAYIALGVFQRSEIFLYACSFVLSLTGTAIGALVVNEYVSQATFMRTLIVLMCICCTLLFAAAAGLTN